MPSTSSERTSAKRRASAASLRAYASALLRHGPGYAGVLVDELSRWMARKGFGTVGELRGLLSVPAGGDEAGYARASYVTALQEANRHVGPW